MFSRFTHVLRIFFSLRFAAEWVSDELLHLSEHKIDPNSVVTP